MKKVQNFHEGETTRRNARRRQWPEWGSNDTGVHTSLFWGLGVFLLAIHSPETMSTVPTAGHIQFPESHRQRTDLSEGASVEASSFSGCEGSHLDLLSLDTQVLRDKVNAE